jgi:electron transport complex protein RnfA
MTKLILIILSATLINNFVWSKFLGICPFLGVSNQIDSAIGMGFAVIFVMTLAAAVTWVIQFAILIPFHVEFLQTIFFIMIIAALVQLVEFIIKKTSPTLHSALGIYLPLITTNCAVLGVTILNMKLGLNFIESIFNAFGSGVGFTLALLLMAGIRERLELAPIPRSLKGVPVALLIASMLSIAFLGFIGLIPE